LQGRHFNYFCALLLIWLSIWHSRSFRRRSPYCLCWLYKKRFIELWTDQKRKSSSSYEQIKNKQVTVLLSNQKAPKW